MSRIGKKPITIPSGVDVKIDGANGRGQRPEGSALHDDRRRCSRCRVTKTLLTVERVDDTRGNRSLHGLQRSLIANMVTGVSEGFAKELEIVGVGYRAEAQGPEKIEIVVGYSHPVYVQAPAGITFEVPQPTRITVRGFDKQLVGQVAAEIRKLRKPEPYKGKGIRYAGERVQRKAGKSAK